VPKLDKYFSYLLFLVIFISLLTMSVLRVDSLHSSFYDYGLLINNLYKISHHNLYVAFVGHLKPLLIPIAYLSDLFPEEISIYLPLVIQSLVLAIPVLLLNRYFGFVVALTYLLYFPLWFIGLFDFHIDAIIVLLNTLFFVSLYSKNYKSALLYALLFPFVKEVYALQTIASGLLFYAISKEIKYSIILGIFGTVYLILSLGLILPLFNHDFGIEHFDSFNQSIGSLNIEKIHAFFNEKKLLFVVIFFIPFIFLPLLRPLPLLLAAPLFLVAILSGNYHHYNYAAHYSSGFIAPVVFAFGLFYRDYIKKNNPVLVKCSIYFLLLFQLYAHYYISISPISRLYNNDKIWRYSEAAYSITEKDKVIKDAIKRYINDRSQSISIQNNLNETSVLQRNDVYAFPDGIQPRTNTRIINPSFKDFARYILYDKRPSFTNITTQADYVLIDTSRPLYVNDTGCEWVFGKCTNKLVESEFHIARETLNKNYSIIFSYKGFEIWKISAINALKKVN
jgi:uncharacterized membrane protein